MVGKLKFLFMILSSANLLRRLLMLGALLVFVGAVGPVARADVIGRGEGDHQFLSFNKLSFTKKVWGDTALPEPGEIKQNTFLPNIDYSYRWRIENGGAQAITQGQVIWNIQANTFLPLPPHPGGRARLSELSEESWSQLALYDVKLKLIFHGKETPEERYGIVLDLGIPNKPGEKSWSITVPKRVSWDKLLTRYRGPGSNNGVYLSSDEARAIVGQAGEEKEFVIESSWLVSARMSTVAFFDDLLQKRVDWRAEVMVHTVEAQVNSLERITSLPVEKIRQALAVTRVEINRNITAVPEALRRLYNKLNKGVPDRYISPVRRDYYHAERTRIYDDAAAKLEQLKPGQTIDDYPTWFDSKVQEIGLE
ncbi:hypothetical protein [Kiloniella sp.]|uniref:hypothetical protein n=1 Tax=Kiloniella sp. TaxID=1938587 RepID=UPI003A8D188B